MAERAPLIARHHAQATALKRATRPAGRTDPIDTSLIKPAR